MWGSHFQSVGPTLISPNKRVGVRESVASTPTPTPTPTPLINHV